MKTKAPKPNKMTKTQSQPLTQTELKQAYTIVTNDLFQKLVKAKSNQTVYLGPLGSFGSLKKTEHKQKCG
jgi:hypothetical protein